MSTKTGKPTRILTIMLMLIMIFTIIPSIPGSQAYAASSRKPSKVIGLTITKKSLNQTQVQGYGYVNVSWKKAKNAKKYIVYYKYSGVSSYKKIATVSKLKLTIKVKTNTKFTIKVISVNGKKKSSGATKSYTLESIPAKPANLKITKKYPNGNLTRGKLHVTWSPAKRAIKYKVYTSYNGGKTWDLEKTVNLPAATFWIDTNKNIKVKVVALNRNKKSTPSTVSTMYKIILPKVVISDKKRVGDNVIISWDAVLGADGYNFYYSLNAGATYKKLTIKSIEDHIEKIINIDKTKDVQCYVCATRNGVEGEPSKMVYLKGEEHDPTPQPCSHNYSTTYNSTSPEIGDVRTFVCTKCGDSYSEKYTLTSDIQFCRVDPTIFVLSDLEWETNPKSSACYYDEATDTAYFLNGHAECDTDFMNLLYSSPKGEIYKSTGEKFYKVTVTDSNGKTQTWRITDIIFDTIKSLCIKNIHTKVYDKISDRYYFDNGDFASLTARCNTNPIELESSAVGWVKIS